MLPSALQADPALEGPGSPPHDSRDYRVSFDPICLSGPRACLKSSELKEWIWEHHKEALLASMTIKHEHPQQDGPVGEEEEKSEHPEQDDTLSRALLDSIVQVQRQCLQNESPDVVFGGLLSGLVKLMDSEYGFIGEAKYNDDGTMYLQPLAYTNSAWNERTNALCVQSDEGPKFSVHDSLYGAVMTTKEPVISNKPTAELRSCGQSCDDHPPMDKFLGIPLFKKGGQVISGVVGLSNKPGGYSQADIDFLEPFTVTSSNLLEAFQQTQETEQVIKVRTRELQLANECLEDANKRVLNASALQLQHFACMSHEIRTPLNCVIGLSSLLLESDLNSMQQESMKMIVSSGDLLLTVVNDVLDYSKLESGNVDIDIEHCSLQETLNSIVHSIATKAASQQLTFRTVFNTQVPEFITTDSRRLQQIMYNLLGNAIKFGKDGGMVELHVLLCPAVSSQQEEKFPLQRRNSFPEEQVIRFVIKDYGKGIAGKDFNRIFQPFQQSSSETERVYGGTGLGLAVTAKLVNALGGTIAVDSEIGQWTEFTIELPFLELAVNAEKISQKMENTTVLLVHKQSKSLDQLVGIFHSYRVNFILFHNIDEMETKIVEQGFLVRKHSYICLVDEDLYQSDPCELLRNLATSVILTYGPKYAVAEATGHYRSLTQVLPSVLLDSMSGYLSSLTNVGRRGLVRSLSNCSIGVIPSTEMRVLIAEDNKINQKVLLRMLKRLEIENVDVVENGQEAVDAEASEQYDVVLMDMQMPVMDGLDACKLICARRGGHAQAKVVFVSAHASSSFAAECARAGSVDFLAKPFNMDEIKQLFRKLDRL